jgi:hypothetical protein
VRKNPTKTPKGRQSERLRIADVFADVFGGMPYDDVPRWPPDVFCFVSAVLHQSGAYTRVTSNLGLSADFQSPQVREERIREIAEQWKTLSTPPTLVVKWWNTVKEASHTVLKGLISNDKLVAALINLVAVSDETCRGVGMAVFDDDSFLLDAEVVLLTSEHVTLCKEINPSRYAVLPKMHTAQSGLTIRSFSHHLAFLHSREIVPRWYLPLTDPDLFRKSLHQHALNLLLIPWPKEVEPSQFIASERVKLTDEVERGSYGLFMVKPTAPPKRSFVKKLLARAEQQVGEINGVIMPELALSKQSFQEISADVVTPTRFFLSGVGSVSSASDSGGENYLRFDLGIPGGEFAFSLEQRKHHRWKLTKSQILQYGIGTNLHPEANWWEHISLDERELVFVNLRPWLTVTPLICEDLARPEPVGDLVRAIGPNLVIALLMDGPQIGGRWPGRYAASLADDPGCSVLTLTSGGMSHLSKTRNEKDRSDTVALWKDPQTGTQELSLSKESGALVLNITVQYEEEWTADGRGDRKASGFPILAGCHQISVQI